MFYKSISFASILLLTTISHTMQQQATFRRVIVRVGNHLEYALVPHDDPTEDYKPYRPTPRIDHVSQELAKNVFNNSCDDINTIANAITAKKQDPTEIMPRKWIFLGKPHVGKTTRARAIATQANVPIFEYDAARIASSLQCSGKENFAYILKRANSLNEPCLIVIRNLEKLITSEEETYDTGHPLHLMLDSLCGDLDHDRYPNVFFIGTTHAESLFDFPQCIKEHFRFNCIKITAPNEQQRASIIAHEMQENGMTFDTNISAQDVAKKTKNFTPRDLKSVLQEAQTSAMLRSPTAALQKADITAALKKIERSSEHFDNLSWDQKFTNLTRRYKPAIILCAGIAALVGYIYKKKERRKKKQTSLTPNTNSKNLYAANNRR